MRKMLVFLVGLVVFGGGAVLVGLYFFSGDVIKTVVEEVGGRATQAKVTLASVSISPLSGEGSLKGLVVGNPKGFKSAQALKLGEVSLKVDPATIASPVIVVKEVTIAAPDITYELADTGGDNIRLLQRNAQSYAGSFGGGASRASAPVTQKAAAPAPAGASAAGDRKVIIENLYVRGGRVNVTATALAGKPLGAVIPDIHLTDIGKAQGGIDPAQVSGVVIATLAQAAQAAVAKIGTDQLKGLGGAQANELMKKLGGGMPGGMPAGPPGSTGGGTGSAKPLIPSGALDRLMGK